MSRWDCTRPWAALLLPPLAWYVFEVGLGSILKVRCASVGNGLGLGWGVASIALCLLAMAIARPCAKRAGDQTPPRAWLSRVALLLAAIFALAIAFQTLAVMIVPPCVG
ncbi:MULTISPECIES: hypothetical protein [Sphingomonas]|uniref:Uncharacterized protein n=1 Tax=Sphingomonas trueperi TaxID=53317 RepID=A0A7X6BF20_9SPHN|nr:MULTISPECIES: hypothetical protein [Sphingomonas]NJB99930.1 hypothetical protein [Sphingomonas trueperi]